MEPFYYNKMNKLQQAVYHGMLQGINALDSEIQIPRIDGRELYDIFFQMRLDHPEVFWATGYQYRDLSEWEKEKYIHDFICENVTYDKLKKAYSHEIIGPLGHGVGVCEGIAKSVKVLCDALGIWCMIAICGNNPEKGIKYRHTWNIVKIGGQYYHLDVTFDNTLGKHSLAGQELRYDYFNLEDKKIFRDHEPLIAPAPSCTDGDHFYYREKKLSFTKIEDVYKRSLQAAKKGRLLTFHWRGGYLTKEVFQELLEQIKKAGDEKQKAARISVNWAQAVIRVSFVDAVEDACIDMEEANEGEQE